MPTGELLDQFGLDGLERRQTGGLSAATYYALHRRGGTDTTTAQALR
ncbi:MAG: hypothetical protein M3393_07130 [Actinomycetota bacterium]|nr:hypothetical protein [Actinomycetota bacterium]